MKAKPVIPPRIAVVSLYDEKQTRLADITGRNHSAYCRHNGYSYISHCGRIDLSRAASWSKLLLVSRVLPIFDYVLWVDTDTVFTSGSRMEDWVLPYLSEDGHILCHAQPGERAGKAPNLNFGVVLFRNTVKTQELIFRIYGQFYQADYPWWEQQAVLSLKEWGMRALDVAPLESFVSYPPAPRKKPALDDLLIFHAYGPCDKEALCRNAVALLGRKF